MGHDCELGLDVRVVFEDDCAGLRVVEAGFGKFYLLGGTDVDVGNLAVGLNGN